MSGTIIPTILGKGWGFPGIGSPPTFCSLMVGVETVMVSMGVALSLDLVSSNQFVISYGHATLVLAVSCPLPSCFSTTTKLVGWSRECEWSVAQSCQTLEDPMSCNPPGSAAHDIFQTLILEWVAIPFPGDLPNPRIEHMSPALAGRFSTTVLPGKPRILTANT